MIMKKHIIYIIIALFSTVFIACDDKKNDDSPLTGSWTYEEPHFQFEYAEDSIVFQIMQEPYKKKVEDLKTEFLAMATEKMGAYFKGVDFKNDGTLKINMSLQGGTTMAMGGTYKTDGKYVQINLDTEILQQIMCGNIPQIPAISFTYTLQNNKLLLYFDKVYVNSLVRTIMGNEELRSKILSLIPGFDRIPEQALPAVIQSLNGQITGILNKTETLELGFILQRQ